MSNWLPNGSSDIVAPTLGNLLSSTVRVVGYVQWSDSDDGYWVSQSSSTASTREFGVYINTNSIWFWAGGQSQSMGNIITLFGSATIDGVLNFELNLSTGAYSLELDGSPITSGTMTPGAGRVDGMLFRIGSRCADNTSGTASAYIVANGSKFGDVSVYIDSVLTRQYVMPSSGTTVPDAENSQDGTLQNGTGGGADWETIGGISFDYDLPIYATDDTGNCKFTFTGTFSGSPAGIEYRVTDGGGTVIDWTAVDSVGVEVWLATPAIPAGTGYTMDVRFTDLSQSASITPFDVGPVVLVTGSSSAEQPFTQSAGTLTAGSNRLHVKSSGAWSTTTGGNSRGGEAIVACANQLFSYGFTEIGFYDYGNGGDQLLVEWDSTIGTSFLAAVAAVENNNVSAIISVIGYNDLNGGNALVTQDFVDLFVDFRIFIDNVPIIHLAAQRDNSGTIQDTLFVQAWAAEEAAAFSVGNAYVINRHDIELSGDNIHNTQAGMNLYCQRWAAVLDYLLGDGTYYHGPVIQSAVYNESNEVTLTLDTTGTDYTGISPTSALAGFQVNSNGTPVTLSAQDVVNATTIRLTSSTALSAPVTVDFAGYNANVSGGQAFANYPTVDSAVSFPVTPLFQSITADLNEISGVLSDSVTLSEISSAQNIGLCSASESFSVADSSTGVFEKSTGVSESVNFVDSSSSGKVAEVSIAEVLSLSDVESSQLSLAALISESLGLSETQTTGSLIPAAISEALTLSDSQVSVMSYSAAISEGLVISSSESSQAVLVSQIQESVNWLDVQTTGNLIAAAISESLGLFDSVASFISIDADIEELITFGESGSVHADLIENLTEGLTFSEALSTGSLLLSQIVESITFTELQSSSLDGESFTGSRVVCVAGRKRILKVNVDSKIIKIEG